MQITIVSVYCGWPEDWPEVRRRYASEARGYLLDLDGEGGMYSPGFVAALTPTDPRVTDEAAMQAYVLARLNARYNAPERGGERALFPRVEFLPEHFEDHPDHDDGGPFIQLQWETVEVEAPSKEG